jgi:hypothetical protein
MGLVKQTANQYYTGSVRIDAKNPASTTHTITWSPNMTPLIWGTNQTATSINNFEVYIDDVPVNIAQNAAGQDYDGTFTLTNSTANGITTQIVNLTTAINVDLGSAISVVLIQQSVWDNYRSYSYVSIKDIVNNFMFAYVGTDKVVSRVNRNDVMFQAKRGLQEFSYDTLKSINQQELTIPPSLSLVLPQDYVNYVQLSWVDSSGVKHIIYPTTLTSNPNQPLIQDSSGLPTQDVFGNPVYSTSVIDQRWRDNNNLNISGQITDDQVSNYANIYNWDWAKMAYGQRYGLDPVTSQKNGWFTINKREGKFSFSSNLANQLITLEYISDGLAYDTDSKVPKMAEEALYAYMIYNIISLRPKTPEYIVQRFKKEKIAKLRNAKIRLSNIKLGEFTQVMRGKSKWIKH